MFAKIGIQTKDHTGIFFHLIFFKNGIELIKSLPIFKNIVQSIILPT